MFKEQKEGDLTILVCMNRSNAKEMRTDKDKKSKKMQKKVKIKKKKN